MIMTGSGGGGGSVAPGPIPAPVGGTYPDAAGEYARGGNGGSGLVLIAYPT